jgi:putative ABC transport system ATP-binding protein
MTVVAEVIRLERIEKSFRIGPVDLKVLKGIDLVIGRGECTAIIGTSGGGKSTLMNIIGMLDTPSSGSYFFEGQNILTLDDHDLSAIRGSKIGFVFQQFNLLPRQTAVENVCLPLVYQGVPDAESEARAMVMLEKVGMGERGQHTPTELSGGQQQRVAIARALVGNPSILLADEPTGALDSRVGQEIMELFLQLNRDLGITLVMITHDPKIAAMCRRQVRITDGLLVPEGETPPASGEGQGSPGGVPPGGVPLGGMPSGQVPDKSVRSRLRRRKRP